MSRSRLTNQRKDEIMGLTEESRIRTMKHCSHRYRGMDQVLKSGKDKDFPTGHNPCENGCGAWVASPYDCGAPPGIDPFGECPKAAQGEPHESIQK